MAKKKVGNAVRKLQTAVITRAQIVDAQSHTNSNAAAARYLGVGYLRYRRYAKIYGLFDSHLNPTGIGVAKGFSARKSSVPLKDIFGNKHPDYSIIRLKHRLIARNMIHEECALCGFKERRITDSKTPLILTFKNGKKDFEFNNLWLLCYNCLFLTTGAPTVANKSYIEKSFTNPDSIPENWQIKPRPADILDAGDPIEEEPIENYDDIRTQVLRELGRDS